MSGRCWKAAFRFLSIGIFEYMRTIEQTVFLLIMYVHGSVYVYLAIRVNTFGYINVFLWHRTDYIQDCLFEFVPEGKRYFSTGDNPRLLSW